MSGNKDCRKYNQPKMHYESKGWGYELWITNTDKYCGKKLFFVKGRKCSLHYHKVKDEVFYIQSGKLDVYYHDDPEYIAKVAERSGNRYFDHCEHVVLEAGDNFYIPPYRAHQMIASQDTELFEFSTQHFEEDSFRIIKGD